MVVIGWKQDPHTQHRRVGHPVKVTGTWWKKKGDPFESPRKLTVYGTRLSSNCRLRP
ncbi:MAG TPA: hypothetical protein VK805_04905 [Candidatus Baltobacteraceae bacterium]|nr:hypothetical protein [Candidatus Baltobacteraceae bacterium]